jgi:aspartate-semialdehyde dehydrogenase
VDELQIDYQYSSWTREEVNFSLVKKYRNLGVIVTTRRCCMAASMATLPPVLDSSLDTSVKGS